MAGTGQGDRGARLLLIDDEPGIRRMMSIQLQGMGYEVTTAEDGDEGLEIFERERPPLVLTDLKMPGLDGLEVLRRIKETGAETEIIVITGHGDMEAAIKALQLEASDFITKPINDLALSVSLTRAQARLEMKKALNEYTHSLESKVAEATAKYLQAERMAAVGETVAALAHAVKNMLCGLKGGMYMLHEGRERPDTEISDQGYHMLGRNVGRVEGLVKDLLTLARSGRPEVSSTEVSEVLSEVFDVLRQEAESKDVRLVLDGSGDRLVAVMDRKAILNAVLNIVSNAIDAASGAENGQVRLGVEPRGDEICFEVEDNGPGLDEEAEARILKGFFSTKGASGTGLGLMVSQKIAQEHGGGIEFENRPGSGATFRLHLPKLPPEAKG